MMTKHVARWKGYPSRSGYVMGCRCSDCGQANREYQLAFLHKRIAEGITDHSGRVLERKAK